MSQPKYYFERIAESGLGPVVQQPPVCLYLEVTNRCNLLCQTCPRTFASVERPADLSFEQFTRIVDQVPHLAQAVLQGIGEPTINRDLTRMIRYLKARRARVVFNTNATLLLPGSKLARELIGSGLDECRISLDAADGQTYEKVRGLPKFDLVLNNVREFVRLKRELGAGLPRLSLWLVGLKETIHQLPDFVWLAHSVHIDEVYLQRLVFFDDQYRGQGLAQAEQALFGALGEEDEQWIERAAELARELGVELRASGATTPEQSLTKNGDVQPWSHCRRPWTLMYITANGNVLPCCISPFVERDYDSLILGNAFQQPLSEIWNGERYRDFRARLLSDHPPHACEGCGVRWSL
jgi:radical SAM protein with 4Fe4S-binding SPASM domain